MTSRNTAQEEVKSPYPEHFIPWGRDAGLGGLAHMGSTCYLAPSSLLSPTAPPGVQNLVFTALISPPYLLYQAIHRKHGHGGGGVFFPFCVCLLSANFLSSPLAFPYSSYLYSISNKGSFQGKKKSREAIQEKAHEDNTEASV